MDNQNAFLKTTAHLVIALASYRMLNRLEVKTILSRRLINMLFLLWILIIFDKKIEGVSEMIVFIPMVDIVRVILDSRKEEGTYAVFFSELLKNEKCSHSGKHEQSQ